MHRLELTFASKEDSLSVRHFAVREAMSSLFEISIVARSPNDDLNLESIVGHPASLRIVGGLAHAPHTSRRWSGVCRLMEQEQAEETGLSTYRLEIVPALWFLTQRRNHRVFQHQSAPEIVGKLLNEWGIEAVWQVDKAQHPKLEYRVQYGESDFAFLSRILEDAGISFTFVDEGDTGAVLHLHDAPHAREGRPGEPIRFIDQPTQAAETEFITKVKVSHEVRPGKVTIRGYDFRGKTGYSLVGEATSPAAGEERLELFDYQHRGFVVEGHKGGDTPAADDKGAARADEKVGKASAEKHLAGARISKRRVAFQTNALDVQPGVVFSIGHHSRSDLGGDARLLVTELSIEGTYDGAWLASGMAVFAAQPYYPPKKTAKPHVHGVESAVVVGPKGQDIYTDEFGRVRVQFHWDREGTYEHSSCWMRVSQGWAGGGFGMMTIPRVGQEVVVGFFEGDPDQPVVVGRVFNNTTRVPYKLPENKTRSTWKSSSSPGSNGFNEIMFEDAKGAELVYVQAERNLDQLVKVDESITIGHNRRKKVTVDETIAVGGSRAATIGNVDEAEVGVRHAVSISAGAAATKMEMVDRRISWTTGEATLTLEGPNITLDAAAAILLKAASDIVLEANASITANATVNMTLKSGSKLVVRSEGGDVVIQGGPIVRINPEIGGKPLRDADGALIPVEVPPGVDIEDEIATAEEHARFDRTAPTWLAEMMKPGGAWDYSKHGDRYAGFSKFHFGMMGKARGFPEGVLLRHAGLQCKARGGSRPEWGDPGNGVWGGTYPYGANIADQEMVKKGFAYFDKNYA